MSQNKDKPVILGYKIRRKSDGMYMKKGSYSGSWAWSKKGHTWAQLHHAIASLKLKGLEPEEWLDLEIVELAETKSYSSAWILDKLTK
jgi:hypothetical protein